MSRKEFKSVSVKFDENRSVSHQFFVKQHKEREETDERPSDMTLFICNVPPYCTEERLKCLFGKYGAVKSVRFVNIDSPTEVIQNDEQLYVRNPVEVKGYKMGYVVFNSAASLQTILSWGEGRMLSFPSDQNALITGLKKWCVTYNASFPDPIEVQKEIDLYMTQHDLEQKRGKNLAMSATESGDDGWIAVSKRNRNPGFSRKQSVKDRVLKKMNRKKKKKALLNFYSFQIKESKMNHLVTLRKKFEEDKKKVEVLKTQRKFKPF